VRRSRADVEVSHSGVGGAREVLHLAADVEVDTGRLCDDFGRAQVEQRGLDVPGERGRGGGVHAHGWGPR